MSMTAVETWDAIPDGMKTQCIENDVMRDTICKAYELSAIEAKKFTALCDNTFVSSSTTKRCSEIDKELHKHYQTQASKIIAIDITIMETSLSATTVPTTLSERGRFHPKLSKLNCFAGGVVSESQVSKVAAIFNDTWDWQVLDDIPKALFLEIIMTISDLDASITANIDKWRSSKTKFLIDRDVQHELCSTTNDDKTNIAGKWAFKFIAFDKFTAKFKTVFDSLRDTVKDTFLALKLGQFDEARGIFIETSTYRFFSLSKRRITEHQIPSDLFDHLQEQFRRVDAHIGEMKRNVKLIQSKRRTAAYVELLAQCGEAVRAKKYQEKNSKKNAKRAKPKSIKKKKNANKLQNYFKKGTEQEEKESQETGIKTKASKKRIFTKPSRKRVFTSTHNIQQRKKFKPSTSAAETALSAPPLQEDVAKCLVCGKTSDLMRCSRCKAAIYCSQEHQHSDWARHSSECQQWAL